MNEVTLTHGRKVVINSNIATGDKHERLTARGQIEAYAKELQKLSGSEEGDVPEINAKGLSEFLIGGAYTRVLSIPKDTTLVSQLWLKQRLWIILSGHVVVTFEEGSVEIEAPFIGPAPFGSKVVVYTKEDTLWAAVTGVAGGSLEELKEELIAKDYADIRYEWDAVEGKI